MRGIWNAYSALHVMKFKELPKVKPDFSEEDHRNGHTSTATAAPVPGGAPPTANTTTEVKASGLAASSSSNAAVAATVGDNGMLYTLASCMYHNMHVLA
jgi:hypothetical protein